MPLVNVRSHLRIISNGMFWSAWLFAIAMAIVILILQQFTGSPIPLSTMMKTLSISLPVFTVLMFANLMAEEIEQRLFAHLFTLRYSVARLVSERMLIAIVSLFLVWAVWSLCVTIAMPQLGTTALLKITMVIVPTNLLLGMVVLMATLVGKNVVVGLICGFSLWLVEIMGRGWHWPIRLTWYQVPDHEMGRIAYSLLLMGLFIFIWLLILAVSRFMKGWIIR